MKIILPVSVILVVMGGVFAAQAEMKLPDLKKQPSDLDFWRWIDAETLFFGLARARAGNGGIGRVAALKYPIGSRSGLRP